MICPPIQLKICEKKDGACCYDIVIVGSTKSTRFVGENAPKMLQIQASCTGCAMRMSMFSMLIHFFSYLVGLYHSFLAQ